MPTPETIIANNDQGRLFDYEIVRRPIEINDAEESDLADFAMWIHYNYRDRCEELWEKFQVYLGEMR